MKLKFNSTRFGVASCKYIKLVTQPLLSLLFSIGKKIQVTYQTSRHKKRFTGELARFACSVQHLQHVAELSGLCAARLKHRVATHSKDNLGVYVIRE